MPATLEQRCSYPGKKCTSERARKPNGTLHKLCELHRRRANLNQKRLQQKRRLLRDKLFQRSGGDDDDLVDFVKASTTTTSAEKKKASPASATSRAQRALSSPVNMDAAAELAVASAPSSYSAQLAYLFADPLLQPDAVVLTSEDVFMLQDVLFDDSVYLYQSDGTFETSQHLTWFA